VLGTPDDASLGASLERPRVLGQDGLSHHARATRSGFTDQSVRNDGAEKFAYLFDETRRQRQISFGSGNHYTVHRGA
jgi:hypothetical protein